MTHSCSWMKISPLTRLCTALPQDTDWPARAYAAPAWGTSAPQSVSAVRICPLFPALSQRLPPAFPPLDLDLEVIFSRGSLLRSQSSSPPTSGFPPSVLGLGAAWVSAGPRQGHCK